jgi:p-aminobenzoyl-glutamate transporter AbgT
LPKILAKILECFAQTAATFSKNLIITLVFEKNAHFLPKIAENWDHNIDPRLGEFSPIGRWFSMGSSFENYRSIPKL